MFTFASIELLPRFPDPHLSFGTWLKIVRHTQPELFKVKSAPFTSYLSFCYDNKMLVKFNRVMFTFALTDFVGRTIAALP